MLALLLRDIGPGSHILAPARVLPLVGAHSPAFFLLLFNPLFGLPLPFVWMLTLGEPVGLNDLSL